ncbi:MAG: GWxTD domain-containing protein [Gemmatimonadota bacterium]
MWLRTFGVATTLLLVLPLACSRGRGPAPGDAAEPSIQGDGQTPRRSPPATDAVALYRRLGLLAEAGETPFVGTLSFLAGRTADTTLMVLTVSLPNRSLRFSREGDRYRSGYSVSLDVKRGADNVRSLRSDEVVRVLAFRETQRSDESVLFRQFVPLVPGTYDIRLHVKGDSVNNGSAIEATVGVPRFGDGALSSPVAFYEATPRTTRDSLPRILPTPRSTVVFGRDSVLPIYVEGYGRGTDFPIHIHVKSDGAQTAIWSDTVSLPQQQNLFGGIVNVPVNRLGVGVMTVGVSREGGTDTLRAPLFIAFGEDLPVTTFSEMLDYLRYYVSAPRLQEMRSATPEVRATLWAAFIRESDPVPQTDIHEGLRDYFGRIAQANLRFRDEGLAGWLSDRGRVLVSLGTPDQIIEPNADYAQRGRTQVWEYRQHRLAVVFVDQSGFGRWRMTLSSETEFEGVARRVMIQ